MLAFIAFRQPVMQAEINQVMGVDAQSYVFRLRELNFIIPISGNDGRLRFATTDAFLKHFNLESIAQLHAQYPEYC